MAGEELAGEGGEADPQPLGRAPGAAVAPPGAVGVRRSCPASRPPEASGLGL